MDERWKEIPGHPGYLASTAGRILSVARTDRPVFLSTTIDKGGYERVGLGRNAKGKLVHHLVARAHLPHKEAGQEIRHLNGDSLDNRACNLAWGTHAENERDKVAHGTHHEAAKAQCVRGHSFDEQNTLIERGQRVCRECRRLRVECPECGTTVLRSNLQRHRRRHRG